MAKPGLVNIDTTQTFQNWFDKTNEMVDLFQTSTLTASALGDTTVGDSILTGNFTATNLIANTGVQTDLISSYTSAAVIDVTSPIEITTASTQTVATFNYAADGGQTRYTDGTTSWDVGIEDTDDYNFIINTGDPNGTTKFSLSPVGTLTTLNIVTTENLTVGGDFEVDGTFTANNIIATNVYATGDLVTQYTTSDIRLKENIQKIENPLEKIDQINGYTFNYKGKDEVVTGVIAQEIEKVLPGVVFETSDESGTFKAVRYGNIVGLLIEAIKELKDEVETLKNGASS